MSRKIDVFIDGEEGTTGLRLANRLAQREDVSLLRIDGRFRKDASARKELMDSADAVFLCLPDAAAVEAAQLAEDSSAKVFDASSSHRTLSGWAYGFPELAPKFRAAIELSRKIAVPGCHASGFLALVYPLVSAGIISADYPVAVTSVTGYSGGGKKMIVDYEDGAKGIPKCPRQYGTSQNHKHLKEMTAVSGLTCAPVFQPYVAGYYSGMEVSLPLFGRLFERQAGVEELREIYRSHYEDSALITVSDAQEYIAADCMAGFDSMRIIVSGNDSRPIATAVFDNLGKGASGAAVQCFNIAFGIEETKGLVL